MTSTLTNKADDSQLLRFSGDELVTNLLQSKLVCAFDYSCIVTNPDNAERKPNETLLTDDVFSLLLGIQHISDRVSAIHSKL